MGFISNNKHSCTSSMKYCMILILCWLFGLTLGVFLFKPFFLPLMCSAITQPVSIVGLFVSIFLPLILTYFSFHIDQPIVILIVCFFKAVAFGFSGMMISQAFSTASWMIRFLLMFSDSCFLIVLFILWLRHFSGVRPSTAKNSYICTFFGVIIATADYFVISPFLEGLF